MEKGLTTPETRDRVRGLLGKELKWRLVPIRIEPAVYRQAGPDRPRRRRGRATETSRGETPSRGIVCVALWKQLLLVRSFIFKADT